MGFDKILLEIKNILFYLHLVHKLPVCNNSTILHGHHDYWKQITTWLGTQFQWRLCYRASVHGWGAQNFHTTCDNKGPTVTIVKVGECIFGGYTDQNWQGINNSFL